MASSRTQKQLSLDQARRVEPGKHGGWRPGAGRPRGRTTISHDARVAIAARNPQHVTLRVRDNVPNLRRKGVREALAAAISANGNTDSFRVVHFNVLANHIHMLVEAANAEALGDAMQGFCVRLAKGINRVFGRKGTVFAERYHVRSLNTPTEVRNALRYVLLNGNHHEAERGAKQLWFGVDPFSSGEWFDGWADERWRHEATGAAQPTAAARTWLLREGWLKAGGPIEFDDTPGATSRRGRARG